MDQPTWNPAAKSASLRKWAESLHREAKRVFLEDGTHGRMLFLFDDRGIASINPIPADTTPIQVTVGVRRAIQDHNLYGVITIAEAWTYMPKTPKDHAVFQLLDGEMTVSEMKEGDKIEALMVRMDSRDQDHVTWLDVIERTGEKVRLGRCIRLRKEYWLNLRGFFEEEENGNEA